VIRKNPSGHLPPHESGFIDTAASRCGQVMVHESLGNGPYALRPVNIDPVND
jgi:hypothetical protein